MAEQSDREIRERVGSAISQHDGFAGLYSNRVSGVLLRPLKNARYTCLPRLTRGSTA